MKKQTYKKPKCRCGKQNCTIHVPQSWLDKGYGEDKLTYEGKYRGIPVYSHPSVPSGILYLLNQEL